MARLPRLVLPGIPHHGTQRGNGRRRTFLEDGDYALCLDLLASAAERAQKQVCAYCLVTTNTAFRRAAMPAGSSPQSHKLALSSRQDEIICLEAFSEHYSIQK